jgi:membrane-bound serine protease (ClpP class)
MRKGAAARRGRLGLALAVAGIGLALLLAAPAPAAADRSSAAPPGVLRVPVTGVIDPFLARSVRNAVERAGREGDGLILLELDTQGGLDSSMREIVKAVLRSPVPVVGYVTPSGARAASAGTFILAATSYAAMAPDTVIGAAHPVGVSGQVLAEKVTNDAAAYIRTLALHHRQRPGQAADWYEQAVRRSVSATAVEARQAGAIEDIHPDEADLLAALDGLNLPYGTNRSALVHTRGAPVRTVGLDPALLLLHRLIDPNVAFLLFMFGVAGLVYEVVHPGLGVSGVAGTLALIVALLQFQALPVQLGGIALLIGGIVLFVLDLKLAGHAFLSAFGVVFLVLGGLLLYQPGSAVRVHPVVLVVVVACVAALFLLVARKVLAARRAPPVTGVDALVGVRGTVLADLAPEGRVRAAGIEWRARAAGPARLPAGSEVVVTGLDGLTLEVEPAPPPELGSPFSPPVPRDRRRKLT